MGEETSYCNKCGVKISPDIKFCSNCGHDLANSSTKTKFGSIKVEVTHATLEKEVKATGKALSSPKKKIETIDNQANPDNSPDNDRPIFNKGLGWIALGSGLAGLSVLLGAFGAHSLKERLSEKKIATFHTATDYLEYHALGLIVIGILIYTLKGETAKKLKRSAIWIVVGIVFFCGSLYGLVFDGPRFLGPITPLGGLSFMIGWFTTAFTLLKARK